MNEKYIIELAKKAGWDDHHSKFDTRIQQFADLILEKAAKSYNGTIKGLEEEIENYRQSY